MIVSSIGASSVLTDSVTASAFGATGASFTISAFTSFIPAIGFTTFLSATIFTAAGLSCTGFSTATCSVATSAIVGLTSTALTTGASCFPTIFVACMMAGFFGLRSILPT